jgi:hypothetical protein
LPVIASEAKQSPPHELEIASAQKTVPRNDAIKFLSFRMAGRAMADYSETCLSLRAEGEAISTPRIGDCFGTKTVPRNDAIKFLSFRMAGSAVADSQ